MYLKQNANKKQMQTSIANIITSSNKIEFDFKYNKCKSMEEVDKSLPTLIIGLENAKKYIKYFDILKKEYQEQNIWWTFSKREKRAIYDIDIYNFNKTVIEKLLSDIKYELIDVINLSKYECRNFIKYLFSDKNKLIYNYYNKFLFIYDKNKQIVYGVSLITLRYFGKDTNKWLSKIYNNKNNQQVLDINVIPLNLRKTLFNDVHKQVVLYDYFS